MPPWLLYSSRGPIDWYNGNRLVVCQLYNMEKLYSAYCRNSLGNLKEYIKSFGYEEMFWKKYMENLYVLRIDCSYGAYGTYFKWRVVYCLREGSEGRRWMLWNVKNDLWTLWAFLASLASDPSNLRLLIRRSNRTVHYDYLTINYFTRWTAWANLLISFLGVHDVQTICDTTLTSALWNSMPATIFLVDTVASKTVLFSSPKHPSRFRSAQAWPINSSSKEFLGE